MTGLKERLIIDDVTFGLEDSDYVTVDDDRRGELPPTPCRLSYC